VLHGMHTAALAEPSRAEPCRFLPSGELCVNGMQRASEANHNASLDAELEQLRQRNRELVDAGSHLEQQVGACILFRATMARNLVIALLWHASLCLGRCRRSRA
jgi:hypothetical protein